MSTARSCKLRGNSGCAVAMASWYSLTNRAQRWRRLLVSSVRRRRHCSRTVFRCMRITIQRSASVSGNRPMAARTLGHQQLNALNGLDELNGLPTGMSELPEFTEEGAEAEGD